MNKWISTNYTAGQDDSEKNVALKNNRNCQIRGMTWCCKSDKTFLSFKSAIISHQEIRTLP